MHRIDSRKAHGVSERIDSRYLPQKNRGTGKNWVQGMRFRGGPEFGAGSGRLFQ